MIAKAEFLKKAHIAHLIRAAAGVTGRTSFVIVGTGAVIAQLKSVPLDLMATREIDIYATDSPDPDAVATLIDGTLGEGSQFDETFGYYAHGVGALTACLPDDWRARATQPRIANLRGATCICPDPNDIALSKVCAWREKDRSWLNAGVSTGVLDLAVMRDRARSISNSNAPEASEIEARLARIEGAPNEPPTRSAARKGQANAVKPGGARRRTVRLRAPSSHL